MCKCEREKKNLPLFLRTLWQSAIQNEAISGSRETQEPFSISDIEIGT